MCNLPIKDAAEHEGVMKGLLTGIRLSVMNPDKRDGDEDKLIWLVDLLEKMIPDEHQLRAIEKMH